MNNCFRKQGMALFNLMLTLLLVQILAVLKKLMFLSENGINLGHLHHHF